MSNIVSIHGYQIKYHDGQPMIQDLELASRLGYERPRTIRDLIKRMVKEGKLNEINICRVAKQTPGEPGRPAEEFWLSEFACLKVTTKSETANADEITNEVIQVFIDAKNGTRPASRRVDPVVAKARRACALMSTYLRVGKMLGTELPMSRAIAVERVRNEADMDFSQMLIGNKVDEVPLTPTDLGKVIGLSARKMNAELERDGFQEKDEHGEWRPSEKGRPYCTLNPFKSPNSDHVGYRILWYRRVLDALTKAA